MKSGGLDQNLIIQKNMNFDGAERNEFGEPIEDWKDVATVPCAKQDVGSREFPAQYKYYEESTVRFVIRFRTDIRAGTHRIVYIQPFIPGAIAVNIDKPTARQRIFNIFPPRESQQRARELLIEAKEVF